MKIDWQPARRSNYGSKRTLLGVDLIILHTVEGSYSSCINTFQSELGNNPRSAHYVISQKGEVTKMVNEDYVAWHCSGHNYHSIGIEQEGFSNKTDWCTDELLQGTATVIAGICKRLGVPPSRDHIKGHSEMIWHAGNSDVGPHYRWDDLLSLVLKKLDEV
jgi:N-acetyl-anhydromuramyl-L-alanine amidase AmpD